MKPFQYTLFVITIIFQCSCKNSSKEKSKPLPKATYPAAFTGQTRIAQVATTTAYKVDSIAGKLGKPWAIITLPDGNFLMTEKSGYMLLIGNDGKVIKKISGLPSVVDSGQGGLLDVALDPDFINNNTIYWSYTESFKAKGTLTAVAKGQLNANDTVIKKPIVIFRAKPFLESKYHFGSRLLFDDDGNLFVTAGERSVLEGRKQSQWLNSGLGKIFKITTEGKPAAGNPFLNDKKAMPEIYSYGHRNPQGLAMHPVTGEIWETEFGPRGGDELNLIKPGKNYGWPIITYGTEYDQRKIGDSIQQKDGMEQPAYFWDPVISPSGMIFYTGDAIPEWKNNLFISGLSSTNLVRLVIENNKVVAEERLLKDKKERLRDVTQHNGALYIVTDDGILFRVSKK